LCRVARAVVGDGVSATALAVACGSNCITINRTNAFSADFRANRRRHAARFRHRYNERMPGSDEMKPAGVKLTYDDFLLFPDDGRRHELIDGEHYVTPSPNTKHQTVSMTLSILIGGWLEAHAIGRVYHAPFDVVLSRFDVVEPDLLYMSNARAADVLTTPLLPGLELPLTRVFRA
jgi:hypothetical protein